MPANRHGPGVVFGAVKHDDFAVAHHRRWVERMQSLPVRGRGEQRVGKRGCGPRRDHRIAARRPYERPDLPILRLLRLHNSAADQCR